ncbi:hypothetical protein D9M68_793320 [compost metagenome]
MAAAALPTGGGTGSASRPVSASGGKASAGSWPVMAISSIGSISGASSTWVASASSAGKGLPLSAMTNWLAAGSATGRSSLAGSSDPVLAWRSFAYIWAKLDASPLLASAGFSGAFAAGAFDFTSDIA